MSDIEIGSVWREKADGDEREVVGLHPENGSDDMVFLNGLNGGRVWIGKAEFLQRFEPVPDMVNHPPHYKDASGVECCQVTDLMMFNAASCFKYLYRCGNKWDDIEDLKKAVWYAKRAYLTGDNEQPNSLEWDNNIKAIASYREHGIYKAMTAIRSYSWLAVAAFIGDEITRLESEVEK